MIFVTGATGFVGSHLVYALLKRGEKVRALKRENASMEGIESVFAFYGETNTALLNGMEWVEGDILDVLSLVEAMQGIRDVYHCAALVSFDKAQKNRLMQVNVSGTANIVNACLETGVRRLCHVSSIGALGAEKQGQPIDENSPRKAEKEYAPYSRSKYLAEMEVWRGLAEGLDAVIVNPALILGYSEGNLLFNKAFELFSKGFSYSPAGANGFVDVRDVVQIMLLLMEQPECNERYVLVSENISYQGLFGMIAEKAGQKPPQRVVGQSILSFMYALSCISRLLRGRRPAVSYRLIRMLSSKSAYSAQKLIGQTGHEFIPLRTTVSDLCTSYIRKNP